MRPRRSHHGTDPPRPEGDAELRAALEAAVERIVPSDDGRPGAREAGTIEYVIARGMSDARGREQLRAIARILDRAATEQGRRRFIELPAEAQDGVLAAFENGPDATQFDALLEGTLEGFYGDPRHGGNRGGVSWELIGFPGPTDGAGYRPPLGWYDEHEPAGVAADDEPG